MPFLPSALTPHLCAKGEAINYRGFSRAESCSLEDTLILGRNKAIQELWTDSRTNVHLPPL